MKNQITDQEIRRKCFSMTIKELALERQIPFYIPPVSHK